MFKSPVKIRGLILFFLLSVIIIIIYFFQTILNDRTKIVFCNVGQGDAAYIRVNNRIDVLIDAGPDKSVLLCLGRYMPFWDREIELAFLSHPNNDHYGGYSYIADRYKIDKFITVKSPFTSDTYKKLLKKISVKQIPLLFLTSGNRFVTGSGFFRAYWPPKNFSSSNDNDFSNVLLFEENFFRVLFTGDASPFVLSRLSNGSLNNINILKIPIMAQKTD
jgi:competence protein ComEC